MGRTWCERRIVWNRELTQFSRIDDGKVVDAIPMAEIDIVQEMNYGTLSIQSEEGSNQSNELPKPKLFNTFQIKTVPNGYNSGRSYYLRTKPDDNCPKIIQLLLDVANAARQKALALSRFKRAQKAVRIVHDSVYFQVFVCLLIFAVSQLYAAF